MQKPLPPLSILPRHLTRPIDSILINHQSLQPHRSPSMDLIRTDPYLRPKSKSHSIRHPRARIPKHARGVNTCLELMRHGRIAGEDCVCVFGRVRVYVGDCEMAGCAGGVVGGCGDGFDGKDWGEEFGGVVFFG